MNKHLLLICVVVATVFSCVFCAYAEEKKPDEREAFIADGYDFKELKWGDTREKIEKYEGRPFAKEHKPTERLLYLTKLDEEEVLLEYLFFNNQLYCAKYSSNKKGEDYASLGRVYVGILKSYVELYGAAEQHTDPGLLRMRWEKDNTNISSWILIDKKDKEAMAFIEYETRNEKITEAARQRNRLSPSPDNDWLAMPGK